MEWELNVQAIGTVRSCFPRKNGTPRQPTIASNARGHLKINKGIYNNPEHSLEGLEGFSHVWLIFVFHKNKAGKFMKAKVSPPRLNGAKIGVFATRSPYRLNPIGLSLVKLEYIEGDTLYFSGHDLVDGTPVLDIKPFIREYDSPSDRPMTHAPSPAGTVEDATRTGDFAPPYSDGPGESLGSVDTTETQWSPVAADSSQICGTDNGEKLCSGDDGDFGENPDLGYLRVAVRAKEDQGQQHSDPESIKPLPEVLGPKLFESKIMHASQKETIVGTCASGQHTSDDPPDHPDRSSATDSGDTWLSRLRPEPWTVGFTAWAESQLSRFSAAETAGAYRLRWLRDAGELRTALHQLLTADPRSVYRRAQEDRLLYHLALDACHVTCWFDPGRRVIEVLRLQPVSESPLAGAAGDGVQSAGESASGAG